MLQVNNYVYRCVHAKYLLGSISLAECFRIY